MPWPTSPPPPRNPRRDVPHLRLFGPRLATDPPTDPPIDEPWNVVRMLAGHATAALEVVELQTDINQLPLMTPLPSPPPPEPTPDPPPLDDDDEEEPPP